ncbi:uncharacterized protein FIBRA_04337 [Fibroporia radiculosa]|uniref:Methyltransferase small domain-containing protein n=1 Tax=Fibroporia radiculosa TaxID=599839 RepID=J4H2W9_9APHY|nr:uncharacterized protein FIBRA_04337 [Fibroporia radiculosa]CCM02254.1 predicted protein [Fibroporia radiculosa]
MSRRHSSRPSPPTVALPPLFQLARCSLEQITKALDNLCAIYIDTPSLVLTKSSLPGHLHQHRIHDTSVPDSGYASAEEDEDDDDDFRDAEPYDVDILLSDTFEREYAIRWLTGFTARSDAWVLSVDSEADARAALVDTAASILASLSGDEEEQPLTRKFMFPTVAGEVDVELNDAPLLSEDHTSVGLQSWASSILLAERICASPEAFALTASDARMPRVLELGAGTGLLSIVSAKVLQRQSSEPRMRPCVIATDYHPSVLSNLRSNVDTNFVHPFPVAVQSLDWQQPTYDGELERPFDVILAADVIYHPEHARWIKNCVEHTLVRPDDVVRGGLLWLIIPLRRTGRHEGMSNTVEEVFPHVSTIGRRVTKVLELAILRVEELERHAGVGRADEGGYKLYEIGWVQASRPAAE